MHFTLSDQVQLSYDILLQAETLSFTFYTFWYKYMKTKLMKLHDLLNANIKTSVLHIY